MESFPFLVPCVVYISGEDDACWVGQIVWAAFPQGHLHCLLEAHSAKFGVFFLPVVLENLLYTDLYVGGEEVGEREKNHC